MRIRLALAATTAAGALAASLLGVAISADATTISHFTAAKGDWTKGAKVVAVRKNVELLAARTQLAHYGTKYAHERTDLTALTEIPLTDTTAAQRATAARATRELNGFFRTPGLYGVAAGNAKSLARKDWIKSSKVSAAEQKAWFAAAVDELDSYASRYATQRAELTSLAAVPLTNTTARQRATARKDVRALDTFFKTPGVNA